MSYTYDNRNRVSTITGNGRTTTFTYDAVGRRIGATWPNNSTATYTYDAAHQLLSLDHKTSGNADIATFAYAYDLAGNRTSMTTLEGVNSYTYNANNWLTGVTYPDGRTQEFTYDPVGNRLSLLDSGIGFQPVQYTYDNANRLLSSVSDVETNAYWYDGAGRLTAQTVNGEPRTYSYDFRSQMTALTDTNAATGNYEFDGDGNRISMIPVGTAGPAVRMVYDGPNAVLDIENGVVKAAYVHGLGIDQPIERIDMAGGRYVYHTDALGSVAAMTDGTGQLVKTYTYEAFGKIRAEAGELANRYGYTGREALGDSLGLMYYRWRVMDPGTGRFSSEDPFGFIPDVHLYRYCAGNPVMFVDSDGRVWHVVIGTVIGAVSGGISAGITGGWSVSGVLIGATSGAVGGAITAATANPVLGATVGGLVAGGLAGGLTAFSHNQSGAAVALGTTLGARPDRQAFVSGVLEKTSGFSGNMVEAVDGNKASSDPSRSI